MPTSVGHNLNRARPVAAARVASPLRAAGRWNAACCEVVAAPAVAGAGVAHIGSVPLDVILHDHVVIGADADFDAGCPQWQRTHHPVRTDRYPVRPAQKDAALAE